MMMAEDQFEEGILDLKKSISCSICLGIMEKPVSLPCSHSFCANCVQQAMKQKESCPICNQKIKKNQIVTLKKVEEIILFAQHLISLHELKKEEVRKNLAAETIVSMKASKPVPAVTPAVTVSTPHRDVPHIPLSSSSSSRSVVNENNTVKPSIRTVEFVTPISNENSSSKSKQSTEKDKILEKLASRKPKYTKGLMVNVLPRTWSGINKLGGAGRIEEVIENDHEFFYRVKYVLDNHRDDNIPEEFITDFEDLDRTNRRNKRSYESINLSPAPTGAAVSGSSSSGPYSRKLRRASLEANDGPVSTIDRVSGSSLITALQPVSSGGINSSSNTNSMTTMKTKYSSGEGKISILLTCIENKDEIEKKLEKMILQLSSGKETRPIEIAHHFTKDVTHIVVSVDENGVVNQRTMKYMQGIAFGLWIISSDWILDSIKAQRIMNESLYEVKSNAKAAVADAPRRSREITFNEGVKLFKDMVFLLFGSFALPHPVRSDVSGMIEVCQGQIFTSVSEFQNFVQSSTSSKKMVIVCGLLEDEIPAAAKNPKQAVLKKVLPSNIPTNTIRSIEVVTTLWVLDSITNYAVQTYGDYQVTL